MSDAATLNCPMCGAAATTDSTQCEHCGAKLATTACPSCFGLIFVGQKFCPHCGARADRAEVAGAATELCPRCHVNLDAVTIGKTNLRECPKCEGIWADAASLQQICADREQQAAVLGLPAPVSPPDSQEVEAVHYIPCPVCQKLMNRVNLAHCSHVIVDVCLQHGTWFDCDELRRIVEFIRAGGMERSREIQIEELKSERSQMRTAQATGGFDPLLEPRIVPRPVRYDGWSFAISAAADVLKTLLK